MSTEFDPYHTWLGIPPQEQPPNHYRLLGIAVFESNPEVISNASDRQMLLLRTFQTGGHSALSQRLLNEVAAAKICLLNPDKKAAYDEQLHREVGQQQAARPPGPQVPYQTAGPPPPPPPSGALVPPPPEGFAEPSGRPEIPERPGAEVPVFDFQPATPRTAHEARARRRRRFSWNSPIVVGGVITGVGIVLLLAILAVWPREDESADLRLESIAPVTVDEGELVSVTARVTDRDAWQGKVTYQLGPGVPDGARIDRQTGEFTWLAQGAGEYRVTVRAAAPQAAAADEKPFRIIVRAKREPTLKPPVLAAIPHQTIRAGEQLSLSVVVEDPGAPEGKLDFSLGQGAPPDMRIDASSGKITWQPAEESQAAEFPVTVIVVSEAPGNPSSRTSFRVLLSAKETARPPVLAAIPDQVVEAGEQFGFSVVLEDPNLPETDLMFGLGRSAPKGMSIDSGTGRISWTPGEEQPAGKHSVTVTATSTAPGKLSDTKTFTIEVKARPDSGPKLAIPDEESQTEVLAKVKELFGEEYRDNKPHARLALAARLIRHARQSEDQPAERYVMLKEAQRLSEQAGDCVLALAAVDELAGGFEVDALEMKVAVLQQAARQSPNPAAALVIADSAFALADEALDRDAYESLTALYRQVEVVVRKQAGTEPAEVVGRQQKLLAERQRLWELSQTAAKTLGSKPEDPQANFEMGRFRCLVEEDWDQALPLLAKGEDVKLRESAAQLVADATDVGGQIALADAWWELAQAEPDASGARMLLVAAARHWYQEALPRLVGQQLAQVESRMQSDDPEQRKEARQPFRISLGGLGGVSVLSPTKVSGEVKTDGGFATFRGKGELEYTQVPAPSYVHEFELTFAAPGGSLTLSYGEKGEGVRLEFDWQNDTQRYRSRLVTYRRRMRYFWGESLNCVPGQRSRFTFYVNESSYSLYQDDSRIAGSRAHPADLRLRVSTGDGTAAVISRCRFRPWTELDAQRVRSPMPPTKIDCDWGETAVRLHERNLGLTDRPKTADGQPFVVASTGTPMLWIPPGSFNHPHSTRRNQATEVIITRGFWIGRYEVTQGEWASVVGSNYSRVVGSPFLPVDGVGFEDAKTFCVELNKRERRGHRPKGYEYRLPTEAEWEYACRAGSQEDFSVAPDGFWSAQNSGWRPHEVGEGKPNPWGLYDMHGNVMEWCFDAYQDEPNTTVPFQRVQDPLVLPKAPGDLRVLRGGAWWCAAAECSSRVRWGHESVPGGHRGFRIVLGRSISGG